MSIWQVTGWGFWLLTAVFSFSGLIYIIGAIRSGSAVTHAGLFQFASAICLSVLFLLYPWNKNIIAAAIPIVWLVSYTPIGQSIGRAVGHLTNWLFSPLFRR